MSLPGPPRRLYSWHHRYSLTAIRLLVFYLGLVMEHCSALVREQAGLWLRSREHGLAA